MGLYFQETELTPFRKLRQVGVTRGGNEGMRMKVVVKIKNHQITVRDMVT